MIDVATITSLVSHNGVYIALIVVGIYMLLQSEVHIRYPRSKKKE
jgi:hypothetical protein